jgi:hypothetical protein
VGIGEMFSVVSENVDITDESPIDLIIICLLESNSLKSNLL